MSKKTVDVLAMKVTGSPPFEAGETVLECDRARLVLHRGHDYAFKAGDTVIVTLEPEAAVSKSVSKRKKTQARKK